ncbi:4-hydroxy-tetrahydrodipicolinate reductase [Polycladidibacter hongkongensis]|uniref:4-hydroxy-tetrahydrodipicolinate reductase n=1 Tax=Polycladidibacter hongkongensis TaxID=1647556 RepID=UPI000835846C|nr:4-hydroxy-tetrahydrodipicolinate reductase [Pseudovibrio hongkongensis]
MSELKIAVVGAGGRMGQALVKAAAEAKGTVVVAGLERQNSPHLGLDLGVVAGLQPLGVTITDDLPAVFDNAQVILDFTAPQATLQFAQEAAKRGLVHIIGTTGMSEAETDALRPAATSARIVKSGNMSLGVNLLASLVKKAAAALDEDFDIEVLEMHHRHKVDAPSGTALMLGEAAAAGRAIDLAERAVRSRDGITGERTRGDIGFATLRGGSVIGEHTVMFASESERIEITHKASDRQLFARGAVKAALWAHDKNPGLYSMADVLGL